MDIFATQQTTKVMIVKLKRAKKHNWLNIKTFAGSQTKIGPELDSYGYPVTGLKTKAEEHEMEDLVGLDRGTLAKTSPFWDEFYVLLEGDKDLELDTTVPDDELKLRFLKAQRKVAVSITEANASANAKFVLYSETEEAKVVNTKGRIKRSAYALLDAMSPADMRQVLLFYGVGTNSADDEFVERKITEKLEENPAKFLDIVKDPKLKLKAFALELVRFGVLAKRGEAFVHGEDTIAHDLEQMVSYLESKENQNMLKHFKEELKFKK